MYPSVLDLPTKRQLAQDLPFMHDLAIICPFKGHLALDWPIHPFNAEFLGTLAFPPLNSWGGGLKKNQNIL